MFLIVGVLLALCCSNVELILVQVEQGCLMGTIERRITGNGTYFSFKGIPYAAPPVGKLRFIEPQPPLPWIGIRSATTHGSICPQLELRTNEYIPGNEDCLFLNVYTPTLKPKSPLAVMFFIHGGGFISGSGNSDRYKPDYLLDQNVIVVTINYRLGSLGLLCLDIKEAPGNAALKDQVAALKWVKKNIACFGGDPDKVTIFGPNAGGSAVSLHVLSPLSKGLFKRAIARGGVFLNDFVKPLESKRRALLFAQEIGLFTKDAKEAFNFLQNATVESLVTTKPFILLYEKPRNDILDLFPFTPVVEKEFGCQSFLTEDPLILLSKGINNTADLILGYKIDEAAYTANTQKEYILKYYPIYKELLVPLKIEDVRSPDIVLKLADRIEKHYFGNKKIGEETYNEFITFYSYFLFIYDIHRFIEIWTKSGNKAYLFVINKLSEEAGVLDDLPYVFGGKAFLSPKLSYRIIVQSCTLLANYAKYGNPTPDNSLGAIWTDFGKNNSYLNIDLQLKSKYYDNGPEIDFWRSIFNCAKLKFS